MKHATTITVLLALLLGPGFSTANTIVTDDFSDGDRTNGVEWTISNGTFPVQFGEANNNNSSLNQFFTTGFTATDLANGEGLRVTLSYRAEGSNLSTVRVGLFDGDTPSADGWDQFIAGNDTRDWRGYLATVGVDGSAPTQLMRNDNTVDDHAFFDSTQVGTNGASISTAGSSDFRMLRLELLRDGADMEMEISEGANAAGLTVLGSASDSSAFFDGFNNVSFYQTTDGGNGHIRYDDITVETYVIPEPASLIMLFGGLALLWLRRVKR